jgi:hypothetical protein
MEPWLLNLVAAPGHNQIKRRPLGYMTDGHVLAGNTKTLTPP